ncbi:hypothetical protein F4V43_02035 [Paenibacillus spiritus]|uniref:Uncharacterized protein n=1 Tax=Paenibacillus spiritus TaxID=2496557 RepID=A0A5J5GGE3_9BACL|nr:hypothetical protein [Paenibacillus spiritus]KAA9007289.1 hypothetical protein F4V43_02035 [Paenibacillus spiritus]
MGVWESDTLEKNFNEIIKEIEKMKDITTSKFKKLEESTGLTKIQKFTPLHLSTFSARLSEKSEWWDSKPILRVEWKGYDTDKYIEQKGMAKGMRFEKNYHYVYIYFDETDTTQLDSLILFINAIAESEKETHIENVEKLKINQATEKKVFDILEQIGISSSYYGYKTNRSKDTTKMYYNFPSEIKKQIPTQYSENRLEELRKSVIEQIKKIWNTQVIKMREERVKKEKIEKEKEQNKKLALLLAKYDLELDDSWDDLLSAIVKQNKYLRLAHYLEKNRNDWSNGCDYAETGLGYFNVENELDQDIEDDIYSYTGENWNGDGRVFRDCNYNFSVLYNIVADQDPQLYKDYEVVKANIEEY